MKRKKPFYGLQDVDTFPEEGEDILAFINAQSDVEELLSKGMFTCSIVAAARLSRKNGYLTDSQFKYVLHGLSEGHYWDCLLRLCELTNYSRKACGEGFSFAFTMRLVPPKEALPFLKEPSIHQFIMSDEEKEYFANLPSNVLLYRGASKKAFEKGKYGISWTTSQEIAEFFAFDRQKEGDGVVLSAEVEKDKILAFFNGRNEYELIIEPECIEPTIFLTEPTTMLEEYHRKRQEEWDNMIKGKSM